MKKSKKAIALILCLVVCLSVLVSCGPKTDNAASPGSPGSSDSSGSSGDSGSSGSSGDSGSASSPSTPVPSGNVDTAPPSGENIKYADTVDIIGDNAPIASVNLFMTAAHNSPGNWIFNMIYDKLLLSRGAGNYIPMLATSWETEDWQTITMKLREDVYFHNGEHFTADDVVYTVMASREATGTPTHDRWADVETVTALDTYTVQFVLSGINVDIFDDFSQPAAGIINEKAIKDDPENGMTVGTGAFTIAEFYPSDYTVLERNDNYWGDPPITRRVILRFVPETSARLMMLQNGQVDVCFSLDPVDRELLEADPEHFVSYPFVMNNMNGIGFNLEDPICGDINFRLAVASAIDRAEVTLAACGIYGIPETTGTLYGYENEFRRNDIPIIPYDLDAAKEYLDASVYNGEVIELAASLETNIIAAEVVQEQLKKIGINTSINVMDPPQISSHMKYGENKSQMWAFLCPQNSLSAAAYRRLFYPGVAYNWSSYNNPRATELYDLAPTLADPKEREAVYSELQEIISADVPFISIFWLGHTGACVKGVGGMYLTSDMFFDLRYVYKVID